MPIFVVESVEWNMDYLFGYVFCFEKVVLAHDRLTSAKNTLDSKYEKNV